ncbi:MAG: hypothetical protein SFV54_26670 [Bryobacteraceae bacterium]|nr:hypothetical protein [Bryobacteraceae bacterium]
MIGPNFAAAPLPGAEVAQYSVGNNWSVTFAEPLDQLLLVAVFWRGTYNFGVVDPTTVYTFSRPFTFASGLGGVGVTGNTLFMPDNGSFYDGVLKFDGPITTLSVAAESPFPGFGQALTFAAPAKAVPEPAAAALFASALAAFAATRVLRSRR